MIDLNVTGDNWNRDQRNGINENWQRIKNGLRNLQGQINILAGGEEVDQLLKRLNDAVESATIAVQESIEANNTATQDAITANNQALQIALNTIDAALTNVGNAIQAAETATNDAVEAKDAALQAAGDAQTTISQMQVIISNFRPRGEWNATTDYFKNNLAGLDGKTYIALQNNTNKPVTDKAFWMLFADRGAKGERGEKGEPGTGIKVLGHFNDISELPSNPILGDAYTIGTDKELYVYNGNNWQNMGSIKGVEGKSAYEVAVENGFVGTEIEWLETLVGPPGPDGPPGPPADLTEINQKVDGIQNEVTEHLAQDVLSENGAHGIRYFNDKLETKNGNTWSEIEIGTANARGTQSISPNHAIRRFPVFSDWANDTTAESLWLVMDDLDLRGQFIVRGAIGNTPASADLGGFEYSLQVQRNAGTNTQEPNEPEILYYSTYMSARFNILGQATIQQTFQPVIPITKRRFAAPLYIEIEYMTVNGNAFDVLDSIEFQLQPPQVAPNTDPQQVSLFKDVAGKANKVQENFIRAVLDMGTQDSTYPISYYKDSLDRVHVEGQAQANGSGMIAFTMPVGYRPKVATQVVVPQTTSPVGMKTMSVQVNGYLIISGLTASSFASFNFSYRVGA